ncbi:MAG: CD3072 family TudS-related putative desulfidase [Gaiellaceae bacterium]
MVSPDPPDSPRFAYLAHCLLNANAKVGEGALCAGIFSPLLARLRARGWTIRQMPCPELAFAGLRRFWAVREQYDTPAYRAHCARLARAVAGQVEEDLREGGEVVIVGVDGSPSMGVHLTASGEGWGGRPAFAPDEGYPVVPGAGLFTEQLLAELEARGMGGVLAVGIGQDAPDYDEGRELARVEDLLDEAT